MRQADRQITSETEGRKCILVNAAEVPHVVLSTGHAIQKVIPCTKILAF